MSWIVLAFGAALSWGMYGASLHRGQLALGNPATSDADIGRYVDQISTQEATTAFVVAKPTPSAPPSLFRP